MTTEIQTSAKIYQFPIGGRQGLNRDQQKPAANLVLPQVSAGTVGGAWYHEAAIQDTKRISEH